MGDTLVIQNGFLLTRSNFLSQCCCDDSGEYWEAIPCQAYLLPSDACKDYEECSLTRRKFINTRSICEGDSYVCECQKLTFPNWQYLTETNGNAARLTLNANYANSTGVFSSASFAVAVRYTPTNTIYHNTFNYSDYSTIQELADAVNAYSPGGTPAYTLDLDNIHPSGITDCILHGTYQRTSAGTTQLSHELPGVYIRWGSQETAFCDFTSSSALFSSILQTRLRNIPELSEIECIEDEDNFSENDKIFYITFKGEQCGVDQPRLSIRYLLVSDDGFTSGPPDAPVFKYGEYVNGFGNENLNYTYVPYRHTTCPYEDPNYVSPSGFNGYAVLNENIQCCPQKGVHLGSTQNYPGRDTYGSEFEYLENTIVATDGVDNSNPCYKLNPFFFTFGKEGRFFDDPTKTKSVFLVPDCDFGDVSGCTYGVPGNCIPELFVPSFSKEISWGPFGSYYDSIVNEPHPAVTQGISNNHMANNAFSGHNYCPSGYLKTAGSWTATTGITLGFTFYKFVPFWLSSADGGFIDQFLGRIDVGTLSSAFTLASGNDCSGITILQYNPSGKTVQNFIDDVNAIRTVEVSGQICSVFNFCGACSSGDLRLPLSKINNLTTELVDVFRQNAGPYQFNGVGNPSTDEYGYSASSIWPNPQRWTNMITDSTSTKPNAFSGFTGAPTKEISLPPNLFKTNQMPKAASYDFVARQNCRPYWLAMAGSEETVATLSKATGSNYEPTAGRLDISVSNRVLNIEVKTGAGVSLASTGLNTVKGTGYTVDDFITEINNIRFTQNTNPLLQYQPVFASTGILPRTIYLDDSPSGYIEPINSAATGNIWTGSYDVTAWIRYRSVATSTESCNDGYLNRCLCPDAARIDPPIRINCDGDNYTDTGWLLTYGCQSYQCKTEWFIKAQRCGCATVVGCSENGPPIKIDHPFNQEEQVDCTTLSSPRFYMCQSNLHSACNIPFLIKVPNQFICDANRSDCYFHAVGGGSCYVDPDLGGFCDTARCPTDPSLPASTWQIGYTTREHGCAAFYRTIAGNGEDLVDESNCWMTSPYDGWCQYIDPDNITIVRREDIPRTWPPTAFLVERVDKPFCTTNINIFDDGAAFPGNFAPCGNPHDNNAPYDSIGPLWPQVPPEYLVPAGEEREGWPCFLADAPSNKLYAHIRPFIKNFDASGLCDTADCRKMVIDCNSRCCYCGFGCAEDTCASQGPRRNCQISQTLAETYVETGFEGCCPDDDIHMGSVGGCNCNNTPWVVQAPCFDNTYTITRDTNAVLNRSESNTAGYVYSEIDGCIPVSVGTVCCWGAAGSQIETITRDGSCHDCFNNCCGFGEYPDCETTNVVDFSCFSNLADWTKSYVPFSGLDYSQSNYPCNDPCGGCDLIGASFYEGIVNQTSSAGLDLCGHGTNTWSFSLDQTYDGTSASGDCGLGIGSVELGISAGPGADVDIPCSGTCNSWVYSGPTLTWLYRGDGRQITEAGSYTVTNPICEDCNFDTVGNTEYNYVANFKLPWRCGEPSEQTNFTAGTGLYTC